MRIRIPHFANTLLFRISATFLLLMGISLGGYYLWIENTIYNPYLDDEEENWYKNLAGDEILALSQQVAAAKSNSNLAETMLVDYGAGLQRYDIEIIVFDTAGRYLLSSVPDSLPNVVPQVSAELLHQMSNDDWDYDSYPDLKNIDAYENRLFEVARIQIEGETEIIGYLAANYSPISMISEDLNADSRLMSQQETIFKVLMGLLIYSAVTALLIMAWTSRRVQRLSAGVDAFAAGDFSHRMQTRSSDEIGTLGHNFNSMAERIEAMVEELRQKEQFQRQLIANVSHDLRTPMASMRGYVETLLMDRNRLDAKQQERYLKIITGNLDHLDRLVEHMLVLSRFDSGQAKFQLEEFSIAELADSILLRFEGLAADMGVNLDLAIADDVGLVVADPLQIGQVLQNLVENAIKFNRRGGSSIIGIERNGARVNLEVQDTGPGIPAEDLPRIFDRFFTGDQSRTRLMADPDTAVTGHHLGQSSGLGLAIAAKIVAGHNSVLRVESRLGKGTVFRFQLDHADQENQDDLQESTGSA